MFFSQVIQTFSAKDQDLPQSGHKFSFKPSERDVNNKNFTIQDFGSELQYLDQVSDTVPVRKKK